MTIPSFKNTAYFFSSKDSCQRIQASMFKLGMRFIHTDKGSPREIFNTGYAQGYVCVNCLYQMSIHYAYPRAHYTVHCATNLHKMAEEYVKAKKAKRKLRKVEKKAILLDEFNGDVKRMRYNAPKSEGWIEVTGDFCRLENGTKIDAKFRQTRYEPDKFSAFVGSRGKGDGPVIPRWSFQHDIESQNDVMYYRLSKPEAISPANQVVIDEVKVLNASVFEETPFTPSSIGMRPKLPDNCFIEVIQRGEALPAEYKNTKSISTVKDTYFGENGKYTVIGYRVVQPEQTKKALWQKYSLPEGYVLSNGKKPDLPDDTLALYLLRHEFRPSGRLIHLSPGSAASIDSVVWGEQKDTTIVAYKVVKPEVKYNLPEGYILSNGVKPDLPGDTPVFVLLRIEFNEDGSLGEVINNSERFLNVWGWNEQGPSTIVAYKVAGEDDTLAKESAGTDTTNPKQALGAAKLPLSLVPPLFTGMVSLGLANGMRKYGGANFIGTEVVISTYLDAIQRHLDAFKLGEECDPVDGVPHIGAVGAGLAIIVAARAAGTLIDDRLRSDGQLEALAALTPIVSQLQELHKDKNPKHYYMVDK